MEVPGAPQGGHIHRQGRGVGEGRQGEGRTHAAQTKFKTAAEMNFNYHSFQSGENRKMDT